MVTGVQTCALPILLALACLSFCSGAEADTTIVNSYAELRDAVKNPVSLDIRLGAPSGCYMVAVGSPLASDLPSPASMISRIRGASLPLS